ncbi:MAG: polysaccharide deacetylase family protein, partial [Planctomycetota bacterium]|nr:polysaccharide deacetylase family protein [Planctomycetota bacterium]
MTHWKHKLKITLVDAYARLLYFTPLWRLRDSFGPRRLLLLFSHCVDDTYYDGLLAPDMCVSRAKFRSVVKVLQKRGYEFVTIADGMDKLVQGKPGKHMVNISMDDGYRDNAETLLPILKEFGIPATVFLETRVLDERRVNWTHHLHWLFDAIGQAEIVQRYVAIEGPDAPDSKVVLKASAIGSRGYYHVKRVLKYDVCPKKRDANLSRLFAEAGGNERELADKLYMTWEQAQELADAGVELGAHTRTHAILSTLSPEENLAEVNGSARAMEKRLGHSPEVFAYPFGRSW